MQIFSPSPSKGYFAQRGKTSSPIAVYDQHGRFLEAWELNRFVAGARKKDDHENFDSLGMPPPDDWELELKKFGK